MKYLSLPTEKVDVETANDILDDIMTRIDRNDDGELTISATINDNLSICEEAQKKKFYDDCAYYRRRKVFFLGFFADG